MIKINCVTESKIKLTDMTPFQGNLKKRTEQDLSELRASLTNEGLMMPFAVWKHDNMNYLLDGHGRRQVLLGMVDEQPDVLSADWPCIYVEAGTEDDARKALLQITSQYGRITKVGVKQFTVSIPDYKAPAIVKFTAKAKPVKAREIKGNDKIVLKVRVSKDKLEQVKQIFSQFDFLELL